ncbi:MAG: cell envelope integrity protein TolA [Spirochaetes bacterium]|nr:cell envelope integrity protein TolA [Spirochaetota bacterium]
MIVSRHSGTGEGFINALGAGLIRIKNDLKDLWDGLKGIGESVGNLVGGKGFNTDAELTEQSKQLVEEYLKIKDMTLLAGVGDANMASAAEIAARKAEIENELAKKDPDALAKLRAESSEGKANAAGLKTAVDAAMKYYDGYDEAVSAAMKEFDKMNENGEMTAKFIEIKNDGQIIIKKNSSGESAVEYSFDKSGGMTGCKLYTNADVSTAGVFDAMDTKNKKSLDYNTLNLYSDAALTVWKDTVGAKSYQSETGYAQNLIQNSIANAAVKMNEEATIGKYGKEAGLSMLKQLVNDSGIKEFGKELWGQSSAGEKAVYIGVGSAVGLAVMNQLVEAIYDSKKANAKEGEQTDTSLKVDVKGQSVVVGQNDKGNYYKANLKAELSKDSIKFTEKDNSDGVVFNFGVDTSNNENKVSVGASKSVVINENFSLFGKVNTTIFFNKNNNNGSLSVTGGSNFNVGGTTWETGYTETITDQRNNKDKHYFFFKGRVPLKFGK